MEILQLKYFYALAQTQHVTRTAQQLHIAQPALTQTIHRLENELEVKLFKSSGRNIVLTEYGTYLMNKIAPVLRTLSEIPEELRTLAGDRNNLLKINVLAASGLMTDTIIEYQKSHKSTRFQVVQSTESEDSDITVSTGEYFRRPQSSKDSFYVFTEEIFLAVPRTSKYAEYDTIRLSNMAGKKFISVAGSKGLRSICDRFCLSAGFHPNVVFESDSTAAVINLIGANIGIGFWPQYTWGKPDESAIALVPISEPQCRRDIIIRLHSSSEVYKEAAEYFEFLSHYFDRLKNNASPNY